MKLTFSKNFFIFAVISSLLLLTACSEKNTEQNQSAPDSNSSSTEDVVELNLYIWEDELLYITGAIDAFNAMHENINVNLTALSNIEYENLLKDSLNDPDQQIDMYDTKGMASTIQLVEEGKMYNMTDFVETGILQDEIDISAYGTLFNDITYEEQYYALPTRATCWALYYNKDIFDQAGQPYPKQMTWEEYAALAKKLTSGTGSDKIWGGYFANWIPNFVALQHGQHLTDDDQQYSRKSLELLNRLYNEDCSHVSYIELRDSKDPSTDVYQRFEAGKVAMVPQGEWMVNFLMKDQTAVNWDIAPLPVDDNVDAKTSVGQYQFISISSDCKHPKEAFEFVKFLCGKEGASIFAQNAMVPAYHNQEIMDSYLAATNKKSTRYFFEAKKYTEQLAIRGYQETIEAFSTNAESYFAGEITLDEAMARFEEERAAVFDRQQ